MRHRWLLVSALILLTAFASVAQTNELPRQFLSVHPTVTLDNLLPQSFMGFGAQYEYVVSEDYSLAAHLLWFRTPFTLFEPVAFGSEGAAVSGEFRYYFSDDSRGWHIGPFLEWSFFKFLGEWKTYHGSKLNHSAEFGGLAGYKWLKGKLTFDISARTAWFSRRRDVSNFYPWVSEFRSHLLISIGYAIG